MLLLEINMLVLVMYDISTKTLNGTKRLSKASKLCLQYGQRVQNSVYEMDIAPSDFEILKNSLIKILDFNTDRLRIYYLGKKKKGTIEIYGEKMEVDLESALIF